MADSTEMRKWATLENFLIGVSRNSTFMNAPKPNAMWQYPNGRD